MCPQYIYHYLSSHPEILARAQAEHDTIFGTDPTAAATLLKNNPHLLNELPYTLAVIKETLRLQTPASGLRDGQPGFYIQYNGLELPTEGWQLWDVSFVTHRNKDLWVNPQAFIPERYLVTEPTDPLKPVEHAWRPFSKGPRDCVGQQLAILEMKLVLVLTLRTLDIKPAYDRLGEIERQEGSKSWRGGGKLKKGVIKEALGETAFQVLVATAKPVEGYPASVTLRS